jgi:hypothetical protein
MAFVSRTTRENNPIGNPFRQSDVLASVGPGSYNLGSAFGAARPSFVPFKSSTTRDEVAAARTAFVPGPGQYDPPVVIKSSMLAVETPFLAFTERFGSSVCSATACLFCFSLLRPSQPCLLNAGCQHRARAWRICYSFCIFIFKEGSCPARSGSARCCVMGA